MSLVATGIGVRYGRRVACEGVDLDLAPGRITALCGPNGAGKSSLLKGLLGLVPTTGSVAIDGRALRRLPARERARSVAYVPQRSGLRFDLPVRAVVAQGRYAHGAGDDQAVDAALHDCDLRGMEGRSYLGLSAGEQQRVLLARALATGAGWLLLDEPTAALDVGHALQLLALLRRLADEGRGLLCVLHDLTEVLSVADEAVLLVDGRVVATGEPDAVLDTQRLRDAYGVSLRHDAAPRFELLPEEW